MKKTKVIKGGTLDESIKGASLSKGIMALFRKHDLKCWVLLGRDAETGNLFHHVCGSGEDIVKLFANTLGMGDDDMLASLIAEGLRMGTLVDLDTNASA